MKEWLYANIVKENLILELLKIIYRFAKKYIRNRSKRLKLIRNRLRMKKERGPTTPIIPN